jgi:hypothetical protein
MMPMIATTAASSRVVNQKKKIKKKIEKNYIFIYLCSAGSF